MKRVGIVLLVLVLVAGAVFAQQAMRRGTYTATVPSYNSAVQTQPGGNMTVEVRIGANGKISSIEVKECTDTAAFLKRATDAMIPAMITANSSEVDIVAGATYSSNALKAAVADAMTQARAQ